MLPLLVSLLAAPAAAPDDKADKKAQYVRIVHVETGKVLAVENDSDEAAARIVLAADEPKLKARHWTVEKDGTQLKLTNRVSGKVLDVNEASADEGAAIIQWDEKTEDYDNQRWSWVGDGIERRLKSKSSGHVLDVQDGKVVQKKADDKAKRQLWKVVEVGK